MDDERVNGSSSENEGEIPKSPPSKYTDTFNEVFPYYLSIGMTYEQFWREDVYLVKAYRKAEELRNQKRNEELWMQGMYIYEALCNVAVVIPRLGKKKVKYLPYPTEPYPLSSERKKRQEKKEKAQFEKARQKMETFATKFNAKFNKKGGIANGRPADNRQAANRGREQSK